MLSRTPTRLGRPSYTEPHPDDRGCKIRSRSSRAAEGAVLGVFVGIAAGAVIGGLSYAMDGSRRNALIVGAGVVGFSSIGSAIAEALPPEC